MDFSEFGETLVLHAPALGGALKTGATEWQKTQAELDREREERERQERHEEEARRLNELARQAESPPWYKQIPLPVAVAGGAALLLLIYGAAK
jgi:hypothetical protein